MILNPAVAATSRRIDHRFLWSVRLRSSLRKAEQIDPEGDSAERLEVPMNKR